MRKLVVFNRVSADGAYARAGGDIDWFVQDPEVEMASYQEMSPDTILFGRTTYQMFESFWPSVADDPNFPEGARATARLLNQMTKVVFSKTLENVTWVNSRVAKGDLLDEVRELKNGDGPDITVFGSGTIVQQLANAGLIDEYLLILTPIILHDGKPMLTGVAERGLSLVSGRTFDSGNVLLHYAVA
jgi:dihydrofolate reductase